MKDVSEKFANWQRLSGSWLKVIAMVSMLIDHTAGQLLRYVEAFNEPLIILGHHHISWYFLMRSAGRLAFPLFAYGCALLLPLPASFRISILILSATPCASIILNLAEMHRCQQEVAANCVLLSTLMCFLTIPLRTRRV